MAKTWEVSTCAMAMAMSASVTVSIGELTTGQESLILFVSCEPTSTCGTVEAQLAARPPSFLIRQACPKANAASSYMDRGCIGRCRWELQAEEGTQDLAAPDLHQSL